MSNGPWGISMKKFGGQMLGCRWTKLLPNVSATLLMLLVWNRAAGGSWWLGGVQGGTIWYSPLNKLKATLKKDQARREVNLMVTRNHLIFGLKSKMVGAYTIHTSICVWGKQPIKAINLVFAGTTFNAQFTFPKVLATLLLDCWWFWLVSRGAALCTISQKRAALLYLEIILHAK